MTPLVAALSILMGLTLGLLGGGGSILAVPILLYAAGQGSKEAIATSLLVVGATSLASAIQHARAGNVRYKTAIIFGAVAMVGAYGGGFLARYLAGSTLLLLFAAMMVIASVFMFRKSRASSSEDGTEEQNPEEAHKGREPAPWLAAVEGLSVGAVTGLVGAGGGFLVVPALVLLGRLGMRAAIGTSALVIALKAFAGFAGHATHVAIDWSLAGYVTAFAVLGTVVGARIVPRIDSAKLRKAFAVFVLLMAGFLVYQEAPDSLVAAVLVERWPFWASGAAIGAFVLLLLYRTGRPLGVSSGYADACAAPFDPSARRSWRLPFLLGIVCGGVVAALAAGTFHPSLAMGTFDQWVSPSLWMKAAVFTGGGTLLGFGARLAGGCTSGHGIMGMAVLARSSVVATILFMISGFLAAQVVRHLGGV